MALKYKNENIGNVDKNKMLTTDKVNLKHSGTDG